MVFDLWIISAENVVEKKSRKAEWSLLIDNSLRKTTFKRANTFDS